MPSGLVCFNFHSLRIQWLSKYDDVWQREFKQVVNQLRSQVLISSSRGHWDRGWEPTDIDATDADVIKEKEEKVVVKCSRRPHNGKTCNFMSWKELKRLYEMYKYQKCTWKACKSTAFHWSIPYDLWRSCRRRRRDCLSWLTTGNDQIQDFAENSSAWQYFFLSFSLGQCQPQ